MGLKFISGSKKVRNFFGENRGEIGTPCKFLGFKVDPNQQMHHQLHATHSAENSVIILVSLCFPLSSIFTHCFE